MQLVIQTRFSFLGRSGWKSDASRDAGRLFDPERLQARFLLFETLTLPSLVAQTDDDFHWDILTADTLPAPWADRLRDVTRAALGNRVSVHARPPERAGVHFRQIVRRRFRGPRRQDRLIQSVLDDDDALAHDFVERCRRNALRTARDLAPGGYRYLSFPMGYWLDLSGGAPMLHEVREPFVNLGLSLVSEAGFGRNPYLTSHKVIRRRHPSEVMVKHRPLYVRSVHGFNDSQPCPPGDAMALDALAPDIAGRFPFLDAFGDRATEAAPVLRSAA